MINKREGDGDGERETESEKECVCVCARARVYVCMASILAEAKVTSLEVNSVYFNHHSHDNSAKY